MRTFSRFSSRETDSRDSSSSRAAVPARHVVVRARFANRTAPDAGFRFDELFFGKAHRFLLHVHAQSCVRGRQYSARPRRRFRPPCDSSASAASNPALATRTEPHGIDRELRAAAASARHRGSFHTKERQGEDAVRGGMRAVGTQRQRRRSATAGGATRPLRSLRPPLPGFPAERRSAGSPGRRSMQSPSSPASGHRRRSLRIRPRARPSPCPDDHQIVVLLGMSRIASFKLRGAPLRPRPSRKAPARTGDQREPVDQPLHVRSLVPFSAAVNPSSRRIVQVTRIESRGTIARTRSGPAHFSATPRRRLRIRRKAAPHPFIRCQHSDDALHHDLTHCGFLPDSVRSPVRAPALAGSAGPGESLRIGIQVRPRRVPSRSDPHCRRSKAPWHRWKETRPARERRRAAPSVAPGCRSRRCRS